MKIRQLLSILFFLSQSLVFAADSRPQEFDLNDLLNMSFKKLITNPSDLEKLELHGSDFRSQEYLDELLGNIWEGLEYNNYYLVFKKIYISSSTRISQIQARDDLRLSGLVRISNNDKRCSTYQNISHFEIIKGLGHLSALQGICGKIAIIHSLKKLGTMKTPFKGKYIKEEKIKDLGPDIPNTGMTIPEISRGLKSFTKKDCSVFRHRCNYDIGQTVRGVAGENKNLAKLSMKIFVARLYKKQKNKKFACSLGMTASNSLGKKTLSHVEYITKVRINPRTKKALIITKNGLVQGDMKKTVPVSAGNNFFSIDPENLKCYFENSTHKKVKRIYGGNRIDRLESICCPI